MPTRTLGRRALNRALLHRQALLERQPMVERGQGSVVGMIERLVGLQAQAPFPPYFGLWSRLSGFRPESLGELLVERRVVRIVLMRGTIHLVSARDCPGLRALVQPALDRMLGSGAWAAGLAGLDPAELAAVARAELADGPLSPAQLGARMARRWPDRDPAALANAARTYVPLVQVPPRAVWGRTGAARHAPVESWLGAAVGPPLAIDDLVRRYLAAFGPASVADVQRWSGLTRLGEVLDRLRPGLRVFRDEGGGELFDLPRAARPDPDTPAAVRLVAPFDNLTLGHADRDRIVGAAERGRMATVNGIIPGTVLVDGFVAGAWRLDQGKERTVLRLEPYATWPARVRDEAVEEGGRLLEFAAPGAPADIRVDPG